MVLFVTIQSESSSNWFETDTILDIYIWVELAVLKGSDISRTQSQHIGPANQSQHISYFGRRGLIETGLTGKRGAVVM